MAEASAYAPASLFNINRRMFSLIGANMNVTTDQVLLADFTSTKYIIDRILVTNASASLTLAAGGIYTAASKGGVAVVAAAQLYSGLTASGLVLPLTIASTDARTTGLFLSLTTAQGGAATADVHVFGYALA